MTERRARLPEKTRGGWPRPTKAELASATTRFVPDVAGPDLQVLFVGINPGLYSGAVGRHFARPGNRFWPTLAGAGFTPRVLSPFESAELPALGLGITNIVRRTTATAAELAPEELVLGAKRLTAKIRKLRPKVVAVLGVTAYRTAFQRPDAVLGLQAERIAGVPVWVLPNPSGLNAHYQLPELVRLFGEVRGYAQRL